MNAVSDQLKQGFSLSARLEFAVWGKRDDLPRVQLQKPILLELIFSFGRINYRNQILLNGFDNDIVSPLPQRKQRKCPAFEFSGFDFFHLSIQTEGCCGVDDLLRTGTISGSYALLPEFLHWNISFIETKHHAQRRCTIFARLHLYDYRYPHTLPLLLFPACILYHAFASQNHARMPSAFASPLRVGIPHFVRDHGALPRFARAIP